MLEGRRAAVATLIGVSLALATAAPASARDAVVKSFDGTPIITSFFPAAGLKQGQKAPTILVGHGWSGSRETAPDSSSDTAGSIFGVSSSAFLISAGYNVLTWDARGFGQSGGTVEVDSPAYEGRDVQALIDYVAKQPEAQLDAPGDPRLGMYGGSYAGGIQLITAAMDKRIDAIAPTIAWNSLLSSLYKDNVPKAGWGTALFATGASAFTGGLDPNAPAGPQTGNVDPQLVQAYEEGLAEGAFSPQTIAFFRERSPAVEKIRIPTLLIQGTADTLFTLKEAITNYDILRRNDVPVKMLWFCGGHGVCLTGSGGLDRIQKAVIAWFRRYLKRDRTADTGPRFEWLADDAKWRTAADYPLVEKPPIVATGGGPLAISPNPGDSGLLIASTDSVVGQLDIPIPALAKPAMIVGEPKLTLTYQGESVGSGTQVFAQILDSASGLVLGNEVTPIPVMMDGKEHTITRPLEAIAASGLPGSLYVLQLLPSTNVYAPQRLTGLLNVEKARIELPVVDAAATPATPPLGLRLALASRRATSYGRSLPVRVSAPTPARGVVLVLRNARGRALGHSRALNLSGNRRVRVALKRRLRPGSYSLTASGRNGDGRPAETSRRFRLR